jgi:hypothetical protein
MRSVLTPCSEIHFPNLPPPYLRDESHNLLYHSVACPPECNEKGI